MFVPVEKRNRTKGEHPGMGSRLVLTTLAGISGTSLMRVLGARYLLQTRVGMDSLQVIEKLVSAKGGLIR